MSSSMSSDGFSFQERKSPRASEAKSLLLSISEITNSSIKTKNEAFIEVGCFFYRIASVIMELDSENKPTNAAEILQALSKRVYMAKDLFDTVISDPDARSIIKQVAGIIKQMGEVLDLITSPEEEYFHNSIQSLVKDIKSSYFEISEIHEPETVSVDKGKDLYSVNTYEDPMDDGWVEEADVTKFPELASYMEPLYETFFCPLAKKIMEDPVTIETGVTYEREAITKWYEKFDNPDDIYCPKTGQKIISGVLNTNIALKETIKQWKERNEQANMMAAKSALSLGSTKGMILEALQDLQSLCRKKQYNVVQVRNIGVLPLLGTILENKDRDVIFGTLELLRQLVEDDDEGKEMITKTMDLSSIVKSLSSKFECVRHSALLLLLELSKSHSLCDKIGSVTGGILLLITLKYRRPVDEFASEKVDEILKNLGSSPSNIKTMAENGHWQPLLHHLTEGSEEMKMEMASYLGEIFPGHDDDIKVWVTETASPALIEMASHGNSLARSVAFKALKEISSHHENGRILVKAGIVSNMFNEMFTRTIYDEPMNSKAEAASILANILESRSVDLNDLQVGHKISLDYIIYNIVKSVGNSMPDELNIHLIRILSCLMEFPKTSATIVSVVREGDACSNLIELVNNPNEELQVSSIKFFIALSPFIGHTLAEKLCKTRGQPQALLEDLPETRPTEKHAVSANFLAKLPHENLTLNVSLLCNDTVPTVLQRINQVQRYGTRTSRYGSAYLEGLVGILVRFTATLYEYQMLVLARTYDFTAIFTKLLMNTSSDEVQRLAAIGLENLSSKSIILSKPPQIKKLRYRKALFLQKCFSFGSKDPESTQLCPVHKGACSSQETFCILEANAIEKLLACLDHRNVKVVEAALSAICTLLDDRVDLDNSVSMLIEENAIQHVLNVIKEHKDECLWQKSFWMIERFLMKGGDTSTSEVSQDRFLPSILISILHNGDGNIRLMAEKILRHLNKMPNFNTNFTM